MGIFQQRNELIQAKLEYRKAGLLGSSLTGEFTGPKKQEEGSYHGEGDRGATNKQKIRVIWERDKISLHWICKAITQKLYIFLHNLEVYYDGDITTYTWVRKFSKLKLTIAEWQLSHNEWD